MVCRLHLFTQKEGIIKKAWTNGFLSQDGPLAQDFALYAPVGLPHLFKFLGLDSITVPSWIDFYPPSVKRGRAFGDQQAHGLLPHPHLQRDAGADEVPEGGVAAAPYQSLNNSWLLDFLVLPVYYNAMWDR